MSNIMTARPGTTLVRERMQFSPIGNVIEAGNEIESYMNETFKAISKLSEWYLYCSMDALIRQASNGKYGGDDFGL